VAGSPASRTWQDGDAFDQSLAQAAPRAAMEADVQAVVARLA